MSRRIASDKVFNIVKTLRFDGYQCGLASLVYNFFEKNSSAMRENKFAGIILKVKLFQTNWIKLHKPIVRKFEKTKSIILF